MGGPGRNGSTQPANPAIMQRALIIIRITSSIAYLSLIYAQKYGIFQYIQANLENYFRHFTAVSDGSTVPNNYTIDKSQLPLFRYAPWFIHAQRAYGCWLRDVVSSAWFAGVGSNGDCGYYGASDVDGVRPVFAIY